MDVRVEKDVELVQHHHTHSTRVKAWVYVELQPAEYEKVIVGFSVEEDPQKGESLVKCIDRARSTVLVRLEDQVKKAFKSIGAEL